MRDPLVYEDLDTMYAAMAADECRETEAFDWVEATLDEGIGGYDRG